MVTIHWVNGQAGGTPLSAENLNLMQQYIKNYIDNEIGNLDTNKQNKYSKTIDTNGWTVLDFGTYKEFLKKVDVDQTIGGNAWTRVTISNLPTELTKIGDCILTYSALMQDSAIISNIGCVNDNSTSIDATCQNKYDQPVPFRSRVHLRIIKLIAEVTE